MKSENVEKGIQTFKSGYNCSQSVLTAFSDKYSLNNELAMSIATGFGAGMGKMQETCGAVTGAFMVLGLHNGEQYSDNGSRKQHTYKMIQVFSKEFKAKHGSIHCKALINCDLNTEEGQIFAHENNVFEDICERCVATAIELVEKMTD
jgi:C_GCAxxG_C_C family probable redox protein